MTDARVVVAALEALAPPRLAAPWDNVGVLLEGTRPVRRLLATVDLTRAVLDEALAAEVDFVVAYHPPWFSAVKRLTSETPRGDLLLRAIRAGLHVYAPHTALDASRGGMADWLLDAFGPVEAAAPLTPDPSDPGVGAGRIATLVAPGPLSTLTAAVKRHLGVSHLRVAAAGDPVIRRVAVCPGSGGSLFGAGVGADLYLTGELGHHDVLGLVAGGAAVLLAEHTHTERGYLPHLLRRLGPQLPGVELRCSAVDADPLLVC